MKFGSISGVRNTIIESFVKVQEPFSRAIKLFEKLAKKMTIRVIKADSTCTDPDAAIIAAESVISEGAKAIIGAVCPKITKAILLNSVIPNKVTMISPAATSSALTDLNDDGFFF